MQGQAVMGQVTCSSSLSTGTGQSEPHGCLLAGVRTAGEGDDGGVAGGAGAVYPG